VKISVLGCGRWGAFIAWYLDHIGHTLTLYGRTNSKNFIEFQETRKNKMLELPETITLESTLEKALKGDTIVVSINAQNFRGLLEEIKGYNIKDKKFVLCMKGIEASSGKRLTEVLHEVLHHSNQCALWIGPGHGEEFIRGLPNCMVIDSESEQLKDELIKAFSSELIRFYYGFDLIGNEIGAATKNVIGIAAGMLDGLQRSSLKGALMSRGTKEVSDLIKVLGGDPFSAYGLCHLGDYEATVFSQFSHNRRFGEAYVLREDYGSLAEGYATVKALMNLSKKYEIELPISKAVYEVLYEGKDPEKSLAGLFLRSLKEER
jgi:glycerol-3-phosphate dehydrogenase (NAD(P)+)